MQRLMVYLTVIGLFLSACSTPAGPVAVPTEVAPTPAKPTTESPTEEPDQVQTPAANAALQALAALLGIDPSLITVVEVKAVEWSDSCLGIVRIDAICAQGVVPGYRITLEADGRQYIYHTNEDGAALALAPVAAEAVEASVAAAVVKALAQALGIDGYRVNVVSVEAAEWSDSCLGVVRIDAMCAQGLVPGYRLMVEANGQLYEYHTNADGSALTIAPITGSIAARSAVQATVEALSKALGLPADQISLVSLTPVEWSNACLGVDLPGMACAEVITPGYSIVLEANEGRLYEYHTNQDGATVQAASLALTWHREGGLAGFCDDLLVYRSGEVVAYECGTENMAQGSLATALSPEDAAKFNEWLAQFGPVSVIQDDGAVADSMLVNLNLTGIGTGQATEAEQAALIEWAQNLYSVLLRAG